jgi:hypothetical protein
LALLHRAPPIYREEEGKAVPGLFSNPTYVASGGHAAPEYAEANVPSSIYGHAEGDYDVFKAGEADA